MSDAIDIDTIWLGIALNLHLMQREALLMKNWHSFVTLNYYLRARRYRLLVEFP